MGLKRNFYDVIVVGAGPAGATLSCELAKRDLKVLLLEKEKLPRYKTCAGGVTVKSAKLLNFDISPVVEHVINEIEFSFQLKEKFMRFSQKPLAYTVVRGKFDHFLAMRAKEAGVSLVEGERVQRIETKFDKVEVNRSFAGRIVVGADGARGIVAKTAGLMENAKGILALEAEVFVSQNDLEKWNSKVKVDLGTLPYGYGWIFPKKDHLSIGVGTLPRFAKRLKPSFFKLLDSSLEYKNYQIKRMKSHFTPLRNSKDPIYKNRILLLGDAAGLANPLSGEGIYYAIKSAYLAAPVVEKCIRKEKFELKPYQDEVDRKIMPELKASHILLFFVSHFTHKFFDFPRKEEKYWKLLCRLVRGEESYENIAKKAKKPDFLFRLLSSKLRK